LEVEINVGQVLGKNKKRPESTEEENKQQINNSSHFSAIQACGEASNQLGFKQGHTISLQQSNLNSNASNSSKDQISP
jgi:hypothetical protein